MLQLHEDPNFHFEALRTLGRAPFSGADVGEILNVLPKIRPRNFDDWFNEWHNLALRVLSTIDESKHDSYSPVTLRAVYFRASTYFFVAEFFLHGNPADPRIAQAYKLWTEYFDKANALLPIPGRRATVPTKHGFEVPLLIYRAAEASASSPRPTLILGGGFDSNMEELYHVYGCAALERGYNVVMYDGPGQHTLVREQNVGFIADWEKAVTPIVDYLVAGSKDELSFIDTEKMGLLGYSLGGYLAARAAAFEPRLAAVVCIDGVWKFDVPIFHAFPGSKAAWDNGDDAALAEAFKIDPATTPTGVRWMYDHLKFSFCTTSARAIFDGVTKMTMAGIADRIKMPAFIGDAEEDIFFAGQPARVAREIGPSATLVKFSSEQAAGEHCSSGAFVYLNQQILEWFANVVGK
ncbi:alpha/beta-hydrolase [Hypoxylon rubiginosum]|uniref:Alpha/beta-hydrolase n=1 Tax=Hypoxylon rubiginosum TaxID=110542 RepID=A0ACB9YTM6_9PEZI|nr:alpha/beta-hydrolase [Hypoxylon rubiginosum]